MCALLIRYMHDPPAAFRPNNAVALSNVAIVGGALANFAFNWQRRHPSGSRSLIDWYMSACMVLQADGITDTKLATVGIHLERSHIRHSTEMCHAGTLRGRLHLGSADIL